MPADHLIEFGESNHVPRGVDEPYQVYRKRLELAVRATGLGHAIIKAAIRSIEKNGTARDIAVTLAQAALDDSMPQPPDPSNLPPEVDDKGIHVPWRERAACKNADPDLFVNDYSTKNGTGLEIAAIAKSFCANCGVKKECLSEANRYEDGVDGVWGGKTSEERKAAANRSRRLG